MVLAELPPLFPHMPSSLPQFPGLAQRLSLLMEQSSRQPTKSRLAATPVSLERILEHLSLDLACKSLEERRDIRHLTNTL